MSALLTALRDGREMKRSRGWIFGLGAAAAVAAAIGIAATNSADPASTRAEPLVGQTPKNMTHPAPSSAPLQTTPAEKLLEQGDLLGAEKSGLARLNTVQASGDVRATAQAWLVLARVATARGRLSEADQRCDHVTAHLKRHPEPTLRQRQLHLTGVVRTQQERFDDATKALDAAVALHGELSKPPVDLAELEVALGDLYRAKGDLTRATAHHRKARRLDAERHGPEHVSAARHDHNLARIRLLEGKSVEAEGLYRRALKTKQRYLGAAHPQLALTYNSLGLLHAASGDHQQAIENYRRALTILKTGFPLRVATCRYNLGLSLLALKRPADAARELDSAKTGFELLMGPEHAQTKAAIAALAKAGGGAQPAVATDVTGKAPGTARPDVAASTARPASAARAAASKPPPPPAPLPPAPSRPKTRKPKATPRPTSGSYMSDRGW